MHTCPAILLETRLAMFGKDVVRLMISCGGSDFCIPNNFTSIAKIADHVIHQAAAAIIIQPESFDNYT